MAKSRPCTNRSLDEANELEPVEASTLDSADHCRVLIEHAAIGIYESTPSGVLRRANPELATILGFSSPDELLREVRHVGRDLYVDPDHRQEFVRIMEGAGEVNGFVSEVRRHDGRHIWVRESARPIRDDRGEIIAYVGTSEDITVSVETALELERKEAEYRGLFENAVEGIYRTSADGVLLAANPALARITGFASVDALEAAFEREGALDFELYVDPDRREQFRRLLEEKGAVSGFISEIRKYDGTSAWIRENARAARDSDGRVLFYEGTVEDITEQKAADDVSRLKTSAAIESIGDALAICDTHGRPTFVNRAFHALLGYDMDAAGKLDGIWQLATDPNVTSAIFRAVTRSKAWNGEVELRKASGDFVLVELRSDPIHDDLGVASGSVLIGSDITSRRKAERQLEALARHDTLTGLANRLKFNEQLDKAVSQTAGWVTSLAVLCIDLDRFKEVNDLLGHAIGDQLLVAVAHRIAECCSPTDLLARLGGDEFAIIQLEVGQPEAAMRVATQVVERLKQPFSIDGQLLHLDASVGIALSNELSGNRAELLRHADIALHRAKSVGRGEICIYEREMHRELLDRRRLERDLIDAIDKELLTVQYQPQLDLRTGKVRSVEALARWRHPELGMVPPPRFIGIAEETGLISALGESVMRQAVRDACSWPGVRVAVNLSPVQIKDERIAELVRDILTAFGLETDLFELEITEGVLLHDTEQTLETLGKLKDLGIKIAMDDFGSGYSSVGYLRRFPFDQIKIDRDFVVGLGEQDDAEAIIETVTLLANRLGMRTIAEGVETTQQLADLRRLGCDYAQGYLIARPMPADQLSTFFETDFRELISLEGTFDTTV